MNFAHNGCLKKLIMRLENVCDWLRNAPFRPFVVEVSNGETFEVRHPENAILLKSLLIVGYPETDRAVHLDLVHINSIEAIESAQQEDKQN